METDRYQASRPVPEPAADLSGLPNGDLTVKKSWSDQNLSEISKVNLILVRFDELETLWYLQIGPEVERIH